MAKRLQIARRWLIYPLVLGLVWGVWAAAMTAGGWWSLFETRWPMALTMVFGSFVAGSTPAGGGAVAYPVFTKALAISSADAALFGLMIQAVGMSMAALFILTRGIRINSSVWRWSVLGAVPGVMIGLAFVGLPENVPRLTFSCLLLVFAVTLYRSHWKRKHRPEKEIAGWSRRDGIRFALTGLIGGGVASQLGSGADMLCFMVMTLGYGLDERIAVPTSVVIMATVSVCGFVFRLMLPQPIGEVWEYWAVSAPVVAVGAPLGAWVASRIHSNAILILVFLLIVAEVISTGLLVPVDGPRALVLLGVAAVATVWFRMLRRLRAKRLNG
ncbi:sulfite exporter TauE/SafE family protein [Haloferula sp.]|uniref:sulfite exporter TauE/SafE family protein n=1 Tax=Haloferula sp. TaxID=2497595 RepID=UPI003C7557ED